MIHELLRAWVMLEKSILVAIGLSLSLVAQAQPGLHHGIVQLDGHGGIVLVTDAPIAPRSHVFVQYPGRASRPACCKKLPASLFKPDPASTLIAANGLRDVPVVILAAQVPAPWAATPFVGAAIMGQPGMVKNNLGKWGLWATDRDGRAYKSEGCTTEEGYRLVAKKGSAEYFNVYLGLGHDTESPTCRH